MKESTCEYCDSVFESVRLQRFCPQPKKCRWDARKGIPRTAATKAKLSASVKQAWDAGKYTEVDFSVPEERRARISDSVKKKWSEGAYADWDQSYRTPEHNARHGAVMKERGHRPPPQFGPLSDEHRANLSAALKGIKKSPRTEEHRKNLGKSIRDSIMRGDHNPSAVKRTHYYEPANIYFRSQTELFTAQHLDAQGIVWEYEPKRFDLGWTTYLPDFYLPDHDMYIEVKGYMDELSKKKLAAFSDLGYQVLVIDYHMARKEILDINLSGVR